MTFDFSIYFFFAAPKEKVAKRKGVRRTQHHVADAA